jgi:hypothetical protein
MRIMDSQEIIRTGRRAKSETEDFINRYLNDQAKGWPRVSLYSPTYTEYPQCRQAGFDMRVRVRQS